MRKSALFISAALTTFVLVILVTVVSAYQTITQPSLVNAPQPVEAAQQQQPIANLPPADSTQAAILTAEQVAQIASQAIGRNDVYSVESTTWNGLQAFLVTFGSGDLVYVSPTGQILEITKLQPQVVTTGGGSRRDDKNNNGNNGGSEREGGEHESGGGGD